MLIYTLITIFIIITPAHLETIDLHGKLKDGLAEFMKTKVITDDLIKNVRALKRLTNAEERHDQSCRTCNYVVDGVLQYRRAGVQKDDMMKLLEDLCVIFSSWNRAACRGRVRNEIDQVLYMIDNRKNLTAERVCGIYLQHYGCPYPSYRDWHVNIPEKPNEIPTQPETNGESIKILHLTDIHFDPDYIPGSNAVCEDPLCCRGGKPEKSENAAGYWGDYNVCDMPWHSVLNLMDQVKQQLEEINYIYYTGDIMHHASWLLTKDKNLKDIGDLLALFLKSFNAIPVYPILGNHEAHPVNYYSPDNITSALSTQWLFDFVAEEWSKWLPDDTKTTIKIGGYYTVLVKKGFRIIALNSNLCYTDNIWLFYEDVDPHGQLQWLADTLAEAEKNGEAVHILSHVPPGSLECWHPWSDEFNRIVRRFSHVIKAQFNGHTHIDEIRVFLDDSKTKACNVAYNGGSFTTFVGMNPNYRIYDTDSTTFDILDYDEWIYNLTEANRDKNTPPKWYKLYSFKEAYGLNSTSNEDLYDWLGRMGADPDRELLKQYFRFEMRDSEVNIDKGCDDNCLDTLLCYIKNVNYKDALRCYKSDAITHLVF